jgi:hypothetical protein
MTSSTQARVYSTLALAFWYGFRLEPRAEELYLLCEQLHLLVIKN